MIEFDKLHNYNYALESFQISSDDELKMNWFLIKNLYIPELSQDKQTILINTLINRNMIADNDHVVIYRPEYFALKLDDLNIATLHANNTHLKAYLTGLIDIYIASQLPYNEIRMKWIINTLIHYKILVNIFDPANKTSTSFKELFEIE